MIAVRRPARPEVAEDDVSRARMLADTRALAGLLDACEAAGVERQALVLRLSRLPPELARPHHLRMARAALDPLLTADRARLFHPTATETVVVWRGDAGAALADSRRAVSYLFGDAIGAEAASLTEHLVLPRDATLLRRLARLPADEPEAALEPAGPSLPPLDMPALALLEGRLATADLARFRHRRAVRRLSPDGRLRLAWEKRHFRIAELAAVLSPEHAIDGDPWLFRRLTRTLDRRMLAWLATPNELVDAQPFSINLNVASLLAPEFLKFDAALPGGLRGHVTIDLLPVDVLADPAAFTFARDFARARGYRLLMRLAAPSQLALLPAERLGVDLVQLRWTGALANWTPPPSLDVATVVLGRAAGPRARAWGRDAGITLFTGES